MLPEPLYIFYYRRHTKYQSGNDPRPSGIAESLEIKGPAQALSTYTLARLERFADDCISAPQKKTSAGHCMHFSTQMMARLNPHFEFEVEGLLLFAPYRAAEVLFNGRMLLPVFEPSAS